MSNVRPQVSLMTPLRKKRLLSLFKRKRVQPCVCVRESEPPSSRYAIREITLTEDGVIVAISPNALSPKASSSAELREKLLQLLAENGVEHFHCGEAGRPFTRPDIEAWLRVIGQPVLKVLER